MSHKVNFTTSGNTYNLRYTWFYSSGQTNPQVSLAQQPAGYTSYNTTHIEPTNYTVQRTGTAAYGSGNSITFNNAAYTAANQTAVNTGTAGYTTTSGNFINDLVGYQPPMQTTTEVRAVSGVPETHTVERREVVQAPVTQVQ